MDGVGGGGGVAGAEPVAERGEQGLGQDAQHDVEVGVEVDGGGQGVGAEGLDDLGQALLDGHAAGVLADQWSQDAMASRFWVALERSALA